METTGYITGSLTIVLIIITGVYAWANWRTMRLLEADLRFRTQPMPHIESGIAHGGFSKRIVVNAIVQTLRAPMQIDSFQINFTFLSGEKYTMAFPLLTGRYLPPGEILQPKDVYDAPEQFNDYETVLIYSDLANISKYTMTLARDGSVTTVVSPVLTGRGFAKFVAKMQAWHDAFEKFDNP